MDKHLTLPNNLQNFFYFSILRKSYLRSNYISLKPQRLDHNSFKEEGDLIPSSLYTELLNKTQRVYLMNVVISLSFLLSNGSMRSMNDNGGPTVRKKSNAMN